MLRYSTLLSSSGETNLAIRDAFYFISSLFPLSRHVMLHAPSSSFLPGVRDHATTPKFKLCLAVFPRRVAGVATRGTRLDKSDTSERRRRRRRGKPFTGGSTKNKVGKGPTNNIHPQASGHVNLPPPDCCRERQSIEHRYILRYFGASSSASSSLGIFAASSRLAVDAKRYIEKLGQRSAAAFFCD